MDKRGKALLLNTLLLVFCIVVIIVFSMMPITTKVEVLKSYNIKFDSAGGNEIAAVLIEEGKVVKKPEAPTREGYIFEGWYVDDEPFDFSKKIDKDVTLTAKWSEKKPDVIYYLVTFDSVGGTPVAVQSVAGGTNANMPISPTKEGFTFKGWQLNGAVYDFTLPVTGDITLVAVWEATAVVPDEPEEPKEKTYTIKFNLDGGTLKTAKTQILKEGEVVKQPDGTPTKTGYIFAGWYNGNSVYKFGSPVTKNITIKAVWTPITYNVVAYSGETGNNVCGRAEPKHNSTISIPGTCGKVTKVGYNVTWKTSTGTIFKFNSTKVTGNLELRPNFSKKSFKFACVDAGLADQFANSMNNKIQFKDGSTVITPTSMVINNREIPYTKDYIMNSSACKNLSSMQIKLNGSNETFTATK